MKVFTWLTCAIFICSVAYSQISSDEQKVRSVIQKMEDAWNAHDYSFSGKYDIFDQNAVLINPVGMYWINKTEIIQAMQAFGAIRFKYESAKYDKVDIRFLAPSIALVIIKSSGKVNEDFNMPDGSKGRSKGETGYDLMGLTLVKKNNDWKITSLQVTTIDAKAAPFNPIK